MAKKQANYRLDESLLNALSDRATTEGASTTDIVERALQQYLGITIHSAIQADSNIDKRIAIVLGERIAKVREELMEVTQVSIDKAIAPLLARIEYLESAAESKKASEVVGNSDGDHVEESIANCLEPDFSKRPHAYEPDTAALPIEKALPDVISSKAIAEAKTKAIAYSVNKKDGSISTRTITGISIANLKKLDTQELEILGIRKKLVDGVWKFFPIEP